MIGWYRPARLFRHCWRSWSSFFQTPTLTLENEDNVSFVLKPAAVSPGLIQTVKFLRWRSTAIIQSRPRVPSSSVSRSSCLCTEIDGLYEIGSSSNDLYCRQWSHVRAWILTVNTFIVINSIQSVSVHSVIVTLVNYQNIWIFF